MLVHLMAPLPRSGAPGPLPRWIGTTLLALLIGGAVAAAGYAAMWFIFDAGPRHVVIESLPTGEGSASKLSFIIPDKPASVTNVVQRHRRSALYLSAWQLGIQNG